MSNLCFSLYVCSKKIKSLRKLLLGRRSGLSLAVAPTMIPTANGIVSVNVGNRRSDAMSLTLYRWMKQKPALTTLRQPKAHLRVAIMATRPYFGSVDRLDGRAVVYSFNFIARSSVCWDHEQYHVGTFSVHTQVLEVCAADHTEYCSQCGRAGWFSSKAGDGIHG